MSPSLGQRFPDLDVLVVGAGPGGMSAALWAKRLDLNALLVDHAYQVGGQLLDLHNPVSDYLGFVLEKGRDLQPIFEAHLKTAQVPLLLGESVHIRQTEPPEVEIAGEILRPSYLILATGAKRRRLNLPTEARFWKKGVSDSASRDREMFVGKRVAIVGGGDAALENALILSDLCPHVYVLVRGETLRARVAFQKKVFGIVNITTIWKTEILKFEGDEWLRAITLDVDGVRQQLEVGGVCLRIGVEPNLRLLSQPLALTESGFLAVDGNQRSSAPRVFAVGDVANPHYSSISASTGQGMVAAKAISLELERAESE